MIRYQSYTESQKLRVQQIFPAAQLSHCSASSLAQLTVCGVPLLFVVSAGAIVQDVQFLHNAKQLAILFS